MLESCVVGFLGVTNIVTSAIFLRCLLIADNEGKEELDED